MQEEWKDIEGFPYQVSNMGSVKSLGRYIYYINGKTGKECKRWAAEKVLKYTIGTSGYPTTHIYTEHGIRSTVMIHRLVGKYFISPIDGKEFINHVDGNKTNNHISNLEWVTKSENTLHAIDTGLLLKSGENCNFSKLNEKQVLEIIAFRTFGKRKYFSKDLAKLYGVSEKHVSELGVDSNRWSRLRSQYSQEDLLEIYNEVSKEVKPSDKKRKPSKHVLTDSQIEEVLYRRKMGERVCDIARDFNKPARFISWLTRKNKDAN